MSGIDVKTRTREDLIKMLTEAAKKSQLQRQADKTDNFWNSQGPKHPQRHTLHLDERIKRRL